MHIAALITQLAWLASHSQSFASTAGSSLVTAVWQGAVIVCVLEIAARLMSRVSAAHRFALWSAGFALSLALPLLSLIHFGESPVPVLAYSPGDGTPTLHPLLQLDARWGIAIAIIWLVASSIRAAALAAHSIRLRRLWKAAQPAPAPVSASLSIRLNLLRHGRVAICTTQLLDRPSVIGFLSPRILIPKWLLSRLTPGELDQIVLHEAEHLRRGDDWTNLLQKLCLVVFPLNPALAWIEHRLCREREMACDEGVVRITNAPRAYAACLASLAERRLERTHALRAEALSLGAWQRRSELVHRVQRILVHKGTMSRTATGALLAALGSMLLAGSVEMSRLPQFVAFVPRHNTQAMTPARQVQLDALLARENSQAKLRLPATYRAVPAKAVLADLPLLSASHPRKHAAPKPGRESGPSSSVAPITAEQIAHSEHLGDRIVSSEPPPQRWLVVTTWREVSSASRMPQTISDFEQENPLTDAAATTSKAQNIAGSKNPNMPAQSPDAQNQTATQARHFTVTQLILRVVPTNSNSNSTQPPTATIRDGWFVIQL